MAACSIQATLASIFQRLRIVEDNQGRSNATVAKLRLEIEDGLSRIRELEFSHESVLREINSLLQRFGEQIATSRRKEQEKLRVAFMRLREEIEEEKNTCRLLKLQNKKLMKELEEANVIAADAGEELDRERQARQLMEEVCNELAREIGEDKAEVEQLRQEQAKSREMVKEELKIMRMASLWQDEGVKAKDLELPIEHDDMHSTDMSLAELKSRVEEFISTVSASTCESHRAPSKEDKQKKIIEQAKLFRQALELTMQHADHEGGTLQAQTDMDLKEEKMVAPICKEQHIQQTHVCDCCSDKAHPSENQRMRYAGGHVELQVRPNVYMLNHSKKPLKDTRRPRMVVGDGQLNHNGAIIPHAKHHLQLSQQHSGVESLQQGSSRRMLLDAPRAPQQSHSPDSYLSEENKVWFPTGKDKEEQNPARALSLYGRGEAQSHESASLCSNLMPLIKGTTNQKPLSLPFEASQDSVEEENADVWGEDMVSDTACRDRCYSEEDDVSQGYLEDEASSVNVQEQSRKGHSSSCGHVTKQGKGTHTQRASPCFSEEHLGKYNDGVDCLMHQKYGGGKSLRANRAEFDEAHGEFDGFYFEPVMDDGLLEAHGRTCHRHEPAMEGMADHNDEQSRVHFRHEQAVDDMADNDEDEHGVSFSKAYNKSVQQSRTPNKELTNTSLLHDGHGSNGRSSSAPVKSSGREGASPPPYKLILPTPSAIRIPSSRGVARSLSPASRTGQVLQCFRPSPTSPEHNVANLAASLSGKGAAEGVERVGGSRAYLSRSSSQNRACEVMGGQLEGCVGEQGQGKRGCGSRRGAMQEEKGNSLRAELLKARELDLAAAVAPQTSNISDNIKGSSPTFRFSPLRRSLTTSSSQAGR